jgi:hypothetical protein
MPLVSHDQVWNQISRLAASSHRKMAAVAYVSSDLVVKFSRNDLLVTDASDEIVAAGLTSGRVIQRAKERGARIVSVARLHAKAMLFDSTLVLGSANLSVNSQRSLIEAAIVTDSREYVTGAKKLIKRLAEEGVVLDDARVAHLLDIDVKRPRSSARTRQLGEPHIVFFKQVLPGDVKKYERESSQSGTGGGAMDVRAPLRFEQILRQVFSEPTDRTGVTHAPVLCRGQGSELIPIDVELWRPTDSREKELRLARSYMVPAWGISPNAYQRATSTGEKLFYVLEMDVFGTVFAKLLTGSQLAAADPLIQQHLARIESKQRAGWAIVGAVDLVSRKTVR